MTIAIIATGDEIVHGDTLNTNAYNIAQILCSEGLPLGLQIACSDKESEIIDSLTFLAKQHDILILIGGLGPTKDDMTRFALSKFLGEPLVQHQQAFDHVQQRITKGKMELNEGNLQQCLFPLDAKLLPNPHGTALGCSYEWKIKTTIPLSKLPEENEMRGGADRSTGVHISVHEDSSTAQTQQFDSSSEFEKKTIVLLPGPPRECLPMFNDYALPILLKTHHSDKQIIKWRIFGLAESEIGQRLESALEGLDCKTGYRLEVPYIEFKVRCRAELVDEIKSIIDPILAPHIISPVEKKASELLKDLILQLNEPVSIVDEATGGLLQTLLTTPDTYPLLKFHGKNKTKLHFHLTGLDEYWLKQPSQGVSQLVIHYNSHRQEGREIQQVPYRSPFVIYYAAEWLSFRLFHLINQLH